jgi:predicted nucleotidyltransferase
MLLIIRLEGVLEMVTHVKGMATHVKKIPQYLKFLNTESRYLYDVNYSLHTVKEGIEKLLTENIKIPLEDIVENDKITEIISEMIENLVEIQSELADYDVVTLKSIAVVAIYDSTLAR